MKPPTDNVVALRAAPRPRDELVLGDLVVETDPTVLLYQVALLLGSTLELREVLHRLTGMTVRTSGAHRCSIFLLDPDGKRLQPAASVGVRADEGLWAAFQEMGPIHVDSAPSVWRRLQAGHLVAVEDATSADLPEEWVERFDLCSVVLVPLFADDSLCGLLVVDYPSVRAFAEPELQTLESLAGYAGIAVRNARLYGIARTRERLQAALAQGAAALVSPLDAGAIAQTVVAAYVGLLGAAGCALALFDRDHTQLTVVAGTEPAAGGAVPVLRIPDPILARLTGAWSADPRRPVVFAAERWFDEVVGLPGSSGHHVVIPLPCGERPRGVVVAAFTAHPNDPQELSAALVLADLAAAALDRAELVAQLNRHAQQLEALHAVNLAIVDGADAEAIIERLNGVLAGHGLFVTALVLRDATLARRLATVAPTPAERAAWAPRSSSEQRVEGPPFVAMRLGGRTVGVLRLDRAPAGPEQAAFLDAVGRGVAEALSRAALRRSLDEAARERALATERERIAADLGDSVGQQLVAIGLRARRATDRLPVDSPWYAELRGIAEMASAGKWHINHAAHAVACAPGLGRTLPHALRQLAESIAADSGLTIDVDVAGRAGPLSPVTERALYRIGHEAIANAWRHARCAHIHVQLTFERSVVLLTVQDDGTGFPAQIGTMGVGTTRIRRAAEEAGGSVALLNAEPRGALVKARVPRSVP